MGRPNRLREQRDRLLPVVARTFAESGYRRATTALIARRCGVRENILYRHWPDKARMFEAAIRHVRDVAMEAWGRAGGRKGGFSFEAALKYEASHLGEFGNYRILFAALSEADDPGIRSALVGVYAGLHDFLARRLRARRGGRVPPELAAWAFVGLGTVSTLLKELKLEGAAVRRRLLLDVGRALL